MVRIFAHKMGNAWLVKIFLGILAQMQGDVGAGAITFRRADAEPAAAITLPAAGAGAAMAPRHNLDTVGHHEGRIKADTELPNQPVAHIILAVIAADAFHEGLGA